MRRVRVAAVVCFLSACWLLSGAGVRAAEADALVADQIKYLNDLADALEKKDEARSREATGLLVQNRIKLEALKLTEEEKDKLSDKHGAELERAKDRVARAMDKFDVNLAGTPMTRAERTVRQQTRLLNELADALEKKDAAGVQEIMAQLLANRKKLAALKLTDDEKNKLGDMHRDGLGRGSNRMTSALGKLDLALDDALGGIRGEALVKEILKLQREGEELAKKDPAKALELLPKIMESAKKLADLKLTAEEMRKLEMKYPDLKGKAPEKVPFEKERFKKD
jgi:hypothetical protein